jgi:hypothetical protein
LKQIIYPILALVFSLAIALVGAEIFIRLISQYHRTYSIEMLRYSNQLKVPSSTPGLSHVHKKNQLAELMGVSIKTNDLGARSESMNTLKDSRLLAFYGGSITLGWGVPPDRTFSSLVVSKLNDSLGAHFQPINFGVGNYNLESSLRLLLETSKQYDGEHFFVCVYPDDFAAKNQGGNSYFFRHSYLGNFLFYRFHQILNPLLQDSEKSQEPSHEAALSNVLHGLIFQTHEYLTSRGAGLSFVFLPSLLLGGENNVEGKKLAEFSQLAKELNFSIFDIRGAFAKLNDKKSLWVAQDDPHPNELGHQLIANAIFDILIQEKNRDQTTSRFEKKSHRLSN